ncbi:PREDICTED: cytochrome P450 4C1-like isoform X2 [Polistes dominula]|uniref:Cytochrome P450 4C1-like isoform X2 n=1 Tax=Polistes dominula TaxID=743375 RepID=A0ABM1IYZ6_POLDO|nr:PREDICTED: cytochrome P450 4C1-like isoform X2 [Polistes dominula]
MIKYLISKIHEYNLVKYFSGHKAYPLIGNIHVLLSEPKDITNTILKEMENYPLPWRIWSGTKLCIISDDPEHIDIISKHSSSFEKSFQYNFVKPYIGNGLIAASASIWESHRQMLNPIFKVNIFSNQMSKIIKHSNRLTRIIENLNEKEIDVHHYIHLFSLDTIYDTILGRDFNFQNNPKCRLHNDISELLNTTTKRVYKFWLHPDIIFYNLPIGKRFREALSHLDTLTWKIIKERKESMQEKKINGEMKEKDATNNTSLFLDTIFKSFYERKEYTEHDIRDEINTIVITGSDTTAFSITFVLLMLAIYPKIQEQVYEELNQIYGSFDPIDKNLSYEDTKNMKCLERVIKETLRLFPAAPFMARNICEDIQDFYLAITILNIFYHSPLDQEDVLVGNLL